MSDLSDEAPTTSELRALLERAIAARPRTSGRELAREATAAGYRVSFTTINQILSGAYTASPSTETIRAIEWLADGATTPRIVNVPIGDPLAALIRQIRTEAPAATETELVDLVLDAVEPGAERTILRTVIPAYLHAVMRLPADVATAAAGNGSPETPLVTVSLQSLLAGAKNTRGQSSRAMAADASAAGYPISNATIDKIVAGTYAYRPSPVTIRAVAWLAHVPEEVARAAAGEEVNQPPFSAQLPHDVDVLTPVQREAVIHLLRAMVATQAALALHVHDADDPAFELSE